MVELRSPRLQAPSSAFIGGHRPPLQDRGPPSSRRPAPSLSRSLSKSLSSRQGQEPRGSDQVIVEVFSGKSIRVASRSMFDVRCSLPPPPPSHPCVTIPEILSRQGAKAQRVGRRMFSVPAEPRPVPAPFCVFCVFCGSSQAGPESPGDRPGDRWNSFRVRVSG